MAFCIIISILVILLYIIYTLRFKLFSKHEVLCKYINDFNVLIPTLAAIASIIVLILPTKDTSHNVIDSNSTIGIPVTANSSVYIDPQATKTPDYGLISTSTTDSLRFAEICYSSKEYIEAFNIYTDGTLDDNPIALCNTGFIYANALGKDINYDMAELYYNKSWQLGNSHALSNHLAANIRSRKDYNQLIQIGINNNVLKIIKYFLACKENGDYRKDIACYSDYSLTDDNVYTRVFVGIYWSKEPPHISGIESIVKNNKKGDLFLWNCYTYKCNFISMLDESFQFLTEGDNT